MAEPMAVDKSLDELIKETKAQRNASKKQNTNRQKNQNQTPKAQPPTNVAKKQKVNAVTQQQREKRQKVLDKKRGIQRASAPAPAAAPKPRQPRNRRTPGGLYGTGAGAPKNLLPIKVVIRNDAARNNNNNQAQQQPKPRAAQNKTARGPVQRAQGRGGRAGRGGARGGAARGGNRQQQQQQQPRMLIQAPVNAQAPPKRQAAPRPAPAPANGGARRVILQDKNSGNAGGAGNGASGSATLNARFKSLKK